MSLPRPDWRAALLTLGALSAGCSEELGPESWPTTRVEGRVREGSRPVAGGWVEFTPFGGTVGSLRSAPIRPDGSFEASGVAVGLNVVSVVHAPIEDKRLAALFRTIGSPIRREIPPGPSCSLTIDLVDEAIRHEREAARGRAGESLGLERR